MAYTNCENTIAPDEVLCSQTHCTSYQETSTMKRVCYCKDWKGNTIPNCEVKGDSYPVSTTECYNKATGERLNITPTACDEKRDKDKNWSNRTCFCCCSCFAWGTRIAVEAGQTRKIEEVGVGETILTASLTKAEGLTLAWAPHPVVFSDGTSPKPGQIVVLIQFGDQGEIVVTTDQPFLMPDGALRRADRLTAADSLVDESGRPVQIKSVYLGRLNIGLHNIAADIAGEGLDGHLICVNGVVAGDHMARVLQSSDEFARHFASGHDDLPVIGTAEYASKAGRGATQFASRADSAEPKFRHDFTPMADIAARSIPFGATSFVTQVQSEDIRKNGTFRPMTQTMNEPEFQYLQKLFSAFYPEIHFVMDWDDQVPNVYAFEDYGIKIVYVSGALLRSTAIGRDGLAFLMAHGVARLIGAPPGDFAGIACAGQADYFAIGYIFIDVLYGRAGAAGLAALREIKQLFGYIAPEHAVGSNRCMDPSIDCRLEALNAALAGLELPHCAGAPSIGTLTLERAEMVRSDAAVKVIATFNGPVFAGSLNNVVNFQIRPVAVVLVAERSIRQLDQVILNVVLPEQETGSYTLTVSNILSMDGSTLDPAKASAVFTVA